MSEIKKVEDYLNSVNYDFSNYIPSKASLNFINFIKLVNGSNGESNKTPPVHYQLMDNIFSKKSRLAILCHRGFGKALSLDSLVYTDNGPITIANIQVGDEIIGEDGYFTKVIAKSEVFNKPMYQIELIDGRSLKVSEDHINTVIQRKTVKKKTKNVRKNLTTNELLSYVLYYKTNKRTTEYNFWIPNNKAIQYSEKELPIDPYTLGLLLGDGSMDKKYGCARLHCHSSDLDTYTGLIPYELGKVYQRGNTCTVGVLGISRILKQLKVNVHGNNKFIPDIYLLGSEEQRLALLRGLMDTDGTAGKTGSTSFCSNSVKLAEGVANLVRSLGGIATIVKSKKRHYTVNIRANFSLFNLKRKKNREHTRSTTKVAIRSITKIDDEPSQCISVDNESNTFLTNNYWVTHNSTLLTTYLPFYISVFGKLDNFGVVNYILMVLDSQEGGAKVVRRTMEQMYNNSDFLKKYIVNTRFTDDFIELENVEQHRIGIKLVGAQMAIRGTRFSNKKGSHRPELVLMDDILKDSDAKSPTVIEAIEHTIHRAVAKAVHPTKNKIIYIGTVFSTKDPLYKVIESGRWNASVYPVCEKFPCSKEEFKGSWEDRFPYEAVKDMYEDAIAMGRPGDFNVEMMNRVMSEEDRLILDSDIVWYKRDTVLSNKGLFNFYITTDFATSESNASDFSVISVWAYNNNGDWLWVDGICKRQLMDKNVNELFKFAQKYKPQLVGIEVTGQQGGFISWIQNEMINRNIYFTLASDGNNAKPGIRPNTNKMQRFNVVVPWFKLGKIWFPEDMKTHPAIIEALEELSLASPTAFKSRHDDWIDTCSMLGSLKAWKPSQEATFKQTEDKDNIWELDVEETNISNLQSYIV